MGAVWLSVGVSVVKVWGSVWLKCGGSVVKVWLKCGGSVCSVGAVSAVWGSVA